MDDRPPRTIYERIHRLGVVSWSLVGLGLLIATFVWILLRISIIIPPLVFAIAIIYLLDPLVDRLSRRGMPRILAAAVAYVAVIGLLTLVGFLVVPTISSQTTQFAENFPEIVNALGDRLRSLADSLGIGLGFTPSIEGIQAWFADPGNRQLILSQLGRLTDVTLGVAEGLLLVILSPVLAFYLLSDLPGLQRRARDFLPARHRDEAVHLGWRLGRVVGGFVRGQLVVALIVGVLSSLGLYIIDLPFWLLIGMIAGLLNLVPYLGPWVGGILGVIVALATRDLATAVWAAVVFLVVQQVDNHFVSPTVLRYSVQLHPATIILALLAGATLGGLLGVLLAVPVVAAIKVVFVHFWRTRVLGEPFVQELNGPSANGPSEPGPSLVDRLRHVAQWGAKGRRVEDKPDVAPQSR